MRSGEVRRHGMVAVAYLVAVVLGRQLVLPETGLALFWPAAGIAALWLALSRTTLQRAVVGGLVGLTVLVVIGLELSFVQSAWWAAANALQAVVVASMLRRRPGLGPRGLTRARQLAPTSAREVAGLGAVSAAAAGLGAVVGSLGVLAAGTPWSWWIPFSWTIRNSTGIFVVVALVALWSQRSTDRDERTPTRLSRLELVAAYTVTLVATVAVFGAERHLPLAFLVIPCAVWMGLRLAPGLAMLGAVGQGLLVLGLTIAGRGPFAAEIDLALRATTVQLFFVLCTSLALLLAVSVAERELLLHRAAVSELAAQERADLLSAVTRVMHEGLLVVDTSGEIVISNPAVRRMLGERTLERLHLDQDSDADGSRATDGSVMAADERPTLRALRGEVVDQMDLVRTDPATGAASVLSVSATPLDGRDGDRLAVLVLSDVTEDRASLAELKGFAGVVAHDLKGPVAGVRGWAEILDEQLDDLADDDGVDVTAARATLLRMQGTAQRVQELIDDLLGYAMAGSSDLHLQRTTLREVWRQAREQLPSDPHDGSELSYVGGTDEIEVDVVLVRQLMVNLLGNAMKYVAPGVTPRVQVRTRVDGDRLRVEVVDNGIGIPTEEQGKVFEGFVRSTRTGDYPGTGLGLAICARAVQRHGGTIGARDAGPDGGTVIGFSLPVAAPLVTPAPQPATTPDDGPGETADTRRTPAAPATL